MANIGEPLKVFDVPEPLPAPRIIPVKVKEPELVPVRVR